MPKVIVLGAGMVGSIMAADLAADTDLEVTIADRSGSALQAAKRRSPRLETIEADLADEANIARLVEPFDLVVGALASHLGYGMLRAALGAGRSVADISFMAEDARRLDELAKQHDALAVVDMGVAPGMSNLLAGYGADQFDDTEKIEIYVGGLPVERRWPYEYKAGFAPADVIEEYTRPSRIVEHGRVVIREAMTEPELLDFDGVGTLEAFNTDGLRSLIDTLDGIPFMVEKTLRYPGHIELMRVFAATGLFSTEPVDVKGTSVVPRDLISTLMFPKWTYEEGEEDLTVMRIVVTGFRGGERRRLRWDLYDRFDRATMATSMARTTAFPCAIMARMILRGEVGGTGVLAPEEVASKAVVDGMLAALEDRGVHYHLRDEPA